MNTEENKDFYAEMANQAKETESKCASKKPAKLAVHELALYLIDCKFPANKVLVGAALVAIFAILEFAFA